MRKTFDRWRYVLPFFYSIEFLSATEQEIELSLLAASGRLQESAMAGSCRATESVASFIATRTATAAAIA